LSCSISSSLGQSAPYPEDFGFASLPSHPSLEINVSLRGDFDSTINQSWLMIASGQNLSVILHVII
jgi:hypothetical protein